TDNNRIQVFDKNNGTIITAFGGFGSGSGQLNSPHGISSSDTTVFVCESSNDRLQLFSDEGKFIKSFNSQTHGPEVLHKPFDVHWNDDLIFVVNSTPLRKITTLEDNDKGDVLGIFGYEEENAIENSLVQPYDVVMSSKDKLIYVTDRQN